MVNAAMFFCLGWAWGVLLTCYALGECRGENDDKK